MGLGLEFLGTNSSRKAPPVDAIFPGGGPVGSTLRKLLARLDAAAVRAWCRVRQVAGRRMIAIDGKTVRGAHSSATTAPHLIAALDRQSGAVPGQHQVAAKSSEIPAARELLAFFDAADLRGCGITLNAMHTRSGTAAVIVAAGADYVFTVKNTSRPCSRRSRSFRGARSRSPPAAPASSTAARSHAASK
ncbi:MAG TPA: ISAs1 family transposase [Mycobacterium sp.]